MSQNQQWVPPTRAPVGGGGSVRRARERMEAGLPPEMPTAPQQKPYDSSRDGASPSQRVRPPLPQALQGQGPIGVAISRPTQVPQWPLAGTIETSSDDGKAKYQPPAGRGPAPPRPARPSRVPSILDASRLQEHTPTFQYKAPQPRYQDEDEDLMSPSSRSQLTSSSRPSTLSSVGTIPDFPIPNIPPPPGPPRRSANLGPPPSSRRGASSYYSQASFVSPIPEENTPTRSHGSYASSAAIPSTWGSESNYEDEDVDDMVSPVSDTRGDIDVIEEGRESRESNDDNEERGLVRKASIGKRVQPSMITTTSSERVPTVVGLPARPGPKPGSKLERMGVLPLASPNPATAAAGGAALGAVAARSDVERPGTQWPIPGDMDSPMASGTGFIDKSTSSSERSVPTLATAVTTDIRQPAPTYNPTSPQAQEMLAAYNGASSLAPPGGVSPGGVSPARTPSPGYSRLSAIRRPPRLDIDAVRDAEARGSLTSLPDLIRRATRLAAMMDRGRRPASRINDLNDFPFAGDEKQRSGDRGDLDYSASDEKHRSGLSGMLAAFPPPGVATPVREQSPRPVSPWPSPYQDSQGALNETDGQQKKKRKCCGLPCWGFLLVLLIILVIIAAAIVVPLELLVFNKPKAGSNTSTTSSTLSSCQNQLKCQNGGSNIVSNGVCSCLCVNGFTGSTCTVPGANGCATTSVPSTDTTGSVTNVTIGDAISRIIDGAQTNFSVPLFASIIVARFNTANLSCISENSLITFDGLDSRTGNSADKVVPTTTAAAAKREETAVVSAAAEAIQSDPSGQTISLFPTTSTVTSIFGSPTASTTISTKGTSTTAATTSQKTTLATTGTVSSTSTTSSTSSAATASATGSFTVTEQVLDFSRVAVLFVLQQETLDSAITAQSAIQKFFDANTQTSSAAGNLSIGNSNTINLVNLSIDLGNGTVGQNNVATSTRKRGVMFGQRGVELYPSL